MVDTTVSRTQAERLAALRPLLPRFRERMQRYDRPAEFPRENFDDLHDAGLLALSIPREYGGEGLFWDSGFVDLYEILERTAAADSSTGQLLQVHTHATAVLSWHASPEQRAKYLPDIVKNGKLVASVGSEADPKSTSAEAYRSELTRTADGWSLTCEKHFASLGPGADYYLMWVALPGEALYNDRLVYVLVPRDDPHVELVNEWDTMGMRSTVSWAVKVTDFPVSEDEIIGKPGGWLRDDPRTFTLAYVANHLGTAEGAFEYTCDYVRQRPYLANSDLVRVALGDMASSLYAARAGLFTAARQWEAAGASGWDSEQVNTAEFMALQALHVAKNVALDVSSRVFDICGARATFRLFPLEQMYRDIRTFTLHFRDDVYMLRVADAILNPEGFSSKGKHGGLLPTGDSATQGSPVTQA